MRKTLFICSFKKNLKKNLIRIGAVIAVLVTFYFLSTILKFKSAHGIDQLEGIYWQPEQTIEVAVLGTSHVHCGVNTGLLWDKYGIAAYDYSGAEQPLWMTYFYLKELYKYQTPEVVVLDLYAPARFKEDYQYDWIGENIYGMKFSLNKLEMLWVSVEPGKMGQYFPSFRVYHSRYGDLEEEDFNSFFWNEQEQEAFKGYTPYWKIRPQTQPQLEELDETEADGLTMKSEKYLRKIIDYTKEKGSKLMLVVIPYAETEGDRQTYREIDKIAEEKGITFIDYNDYYDEIGLDFHKDFNDESHLNYWGSCKFSDYLGSIVAEYEGVADLRGKEEYTSWDDNAELILRELKSYEEGTLEKLEE